MKSLLNIVGITLVTRALTHPVLASELQNRAHQASAKQYQVLHENGHVMWHEAWTHQVTNIGDSTVVAVIVESQPSLSPSKGAE